MKAIVSTLIGILIGLSIISLGGCDKESVYEPSTKTVEDVVLDWKSDAIKHGVDPSLVDEIEFRFEPGTDGVAGTYGAGVIRINSDRWSGSEKSINTVYHEIGHHFGLRHGATEIMSLHQAPNTVMRNKSEYFELIKQQLENDNL